MNEQMTADIRHAIAGLVRHGLRERGETDNLARFATDAWDVDVILPDGLHVVTWTASGEVLCSIPGDTVAQAVGLLRAKRDADTARRN
jgi:hypothetical protein